MYHILENIFFYGTVKIEVNIVKIEFNIDKTKTEPVIVINCNEMNSDIENIIATLQMFNKRICVVKENQNFIIEANEISYIESVERKTFVYTNTDIYESKLKLYEMEEKLCESNFIRANKSCIVNLRHIKSIKNDIERRLRATLLSGEQIIISRQYAEEIKKRLGVC